MLNYNDDTIRETGEKYYVEKKRIKKECIADRSDKITGVWYPSAFLSLFSQLPIPWQPLFWECIRYLILTRFPICHQTFETETTSQILEETATRLFHNTDIENLYKNPSATYTNLLVGSVCRQYLYFFCSPEDLQYFLG